MAEKRRILSKKELIKNIQTCANSIHDNAEDILGNEKYFTDLTISFKISRDPNEVLQIKMTRNFIPEGVIDDEE